MSFFINKSVARCCLNFCCLSPSLLKVIMTDPEHLLWRVSTSALRLVAAAVTPIDVLDGVTSTTFDDAMPAASEPSHITKLLLPKQQYEALFVSPPPDPVGFPFYLPEYPSRAAQTFSALEGLFRAQLPGGALNAAGPEALFPMELIFGNAHKAAKEDSIDKYPVFGGSMDRFYPFHFTSFFMFSSLAKTASTICLGVSVVAYVGLTVVNPVMESTAAGPISKGPTIIAIGLLGCMTLSAFISVVFDVVSAITFALAPAAIRRQQPHNGDNSVSSLLKAGTIAYNQSLGTVVEPLLTLCAVLGSLFYRLIVQEYAPSVVPTPFAGVISNEVLNGCLVAFVIFHILTLVACRQWVFSTTPEASDPDASDVVADFVDSRIEPRPVELLRTPDVEVTSEGEGEVVKLRAVSTTFQQMWEAAGCKDTRGCIEIPRPGQFSDGINRTPTKHVDSMRSIVIPVIHKLVFLAAILMIFLADSSSLSRHRPIQNGARMFISGMLYSTVALVLLAESAVVMRANFWRAASGWRRAQLEWMKTRVVNILPVTLRSNLFVSKWSFMGALFGLQLGVTAACVKFTWEWPPVISEAHAGFSWLLFALVMVCGVLFAATLILVYTAVQCAGCIYCVARACRASGTPMFRPVVHAYLDGVYDLCHVGHKKMFQHALTVADRVIVGVMSDEDCVSYKRRPIMTTGERMREILNCNINIGGKAVFRVLPHSPNRGLPLHFLVRSGISRVLMGQEYVKDSDKYYIAARLLAQMAVIAPRTGGISTSDIMKRIQEIPK